MKQPHQEHELNQRWNTDKHRAATKLKSFASSSRASRLRGESPAQDSPRSREERQEREDFAKKNPFLPAKDFRVGSTDLCPSVFICGFIQPARVWGRARDSTASCSRGNLPGWRPYRCRPRG